MLGKRNIHHLGGVLAFAMLGVTLASGYAGETQKAATAPDIHALPEGALQRLGSLDWRHGEPITFLALPAGGKTIVTATHDAVLRLWDRETGKEIQRFVPPADANVKGRAVHPYMQGLTRAALSKDGKLLAVVLTSNVVQLWDVETGKALHQIKSPANGVSAMAFAPDGKTLAIRGASDRICHLHETQTGKELRTLKPAHPSGKGGNISGGADNGTGLAFSPDSKTIALPELEYVNQVVSGSVTLFEVDTGKEVRRIEPPTHGIAAITFSPDGKTLVFNTLSTIHMKEADTGNEIRQLKGFFGANQMVYAPDGKTLAVRGRDQTVRLFDPATGNLLHTLAAPGPKGRNVINSSNGGPTSDMAYSADSKTLVIGGQQVPRFFDVASGKELTLPGGGHGGVVSALTISADGKTIVSRGAEGVLRVWDNVTHKETRQFTETAGTSAVQFSPDGKLVAVGNNDGTVRVLDIADGKEKRQWKAHQGTIASIAFSADGRQLATRGSYDGILRTFDIEKGVELKQIVFQDIKAGNGGVIFVRSLNGSVDGHPLAFSPDGKTLATFVAPLQVQVQGQQQVQPDTNCLRLFDVDTGKEVRKIQMPVGCNIQHLVYSLDGRLLISENLDKTISLWEIASGQERSRFGAPVAAVPQTNMTSFVVINGIARSGPALAPLGMTLATSRDGRLIAAAGPNHSIRVYDASLGKEVGAFRGHDGPFASLVFADDGKTLVSGGNDTTILVWDLGRLKREVAAPIPEFQPKEFDGLWNDLFSSDAGRAGKAVQALIAHKTTPALLKDRIHPATPADPKAVEQWLRDLGSSNFTKRATATRELEKLDELAVPALQKLLTTQLALETRRRVEFLLEELTGRHLSPEQIRVVRVVEVLEKIGTPDARELLDRLADGAAGSLTTRQAQISLQRLRGKL